MASLISIISASTTTSAGNPEEAQEYGALKKRLAEQHRDDRLAYRDAKTEFVTGALRAAGG